MRLLSTLALLLMAAAAQGDLVVEQKVESPMTTGTITTKIRPDVARIDTPSPSGGSVTVIISINDGVMTSLMHQRKLAMVMDLSTMRAKADQAQKMMGIDPASVKPVATGQTETVGVWDTEIYAVSAGGMELRFWVAKNFPEFAKYKEAMTKFSKAASGGALDPNTFNLPGMVVKSVGTMPMGKMTTTLVGIKEANVPDSEYIVPQDYQMVGR